MHTKQRLFSLCFLLALAGLISGCGRGFGSTDWPLLGVYDGTFNGAWIVGSKEQAFTGATPISVLPDQANQVLVVEVTSIGCRFTAQSEGYFATARPAPDCTWPDPVDPNFVTTLSLRAGSAYGSPTQITMNLTGNFVASQRGKPYSTGTFRFDYTGLRSR